MPDYFDMGFCVRQPSWHKQEVLLQDYPGRDEAMRIAGHDFTVVEMPVFNQAGAQLPNWKAITNQTTGNIFNVTRESYTIVQNDVAWDIVDALVDMQNVKYETAGILKDGGVLWCLARVDEPSQVNGDNSWIYPYIAVSWSHDGTGAIKADQTDVRVVCWNTYSYATEKAKDEGLTFTFKHTAKVHDRIDAAKAALTGARTKHAAFMELANELATMPINQDGVRVFVETFIPMPVGDVISDRVRLNVIEAREAVLGIINGPSLVEVPNTAYKMLQAGVEYLDHVRGYRSKDSYIRRTLLTREAMKDKLVGTVKDLAMEFAG